MNVKKKQSGPSEAILVRLPEELLHPLDALRRAEPDPPTRPEMIRRILQAWIEQNAPRG
jgi:metal-responsive CopG/Arc/MetJ family transcriptional regulator